MSALLLRRILVSALVAGCALALDIGPAFAACPPDTQPCNDRCIPETSLCILEPVPGGIDEVQSGGPPLAPFLTYVNGGVWQWAFRIGVAVAVLNGTAGGFQIVLSNGDSGKVDAGKKRFLSSAIGLLLLLLSGVILEFLNPFGFANV